MSNGRRGSRAVTPKRTWRKGQLQEWLDDRKIQWDAKSSKAELLQLAFANVPPKRYVTNAIARAFDVEIFRLPIKHCVLNPTELAWAQLKSYVRRENVSFRISDVENLAREFMAAVDKDLARNFIEHTQKVEEIFKTADAFVEDSVEPQLMIRMMKMTSICTILANATVLSRHSEHVLINFKLYPLE